MFTLAYRSIMMTIAKFCFNEAMTNSQPGEPCPECGCDTTLRMGKYGMFYGCTQFPLCRGSHNI